MSKIHRLIECIVLHLSASRHHSLQRLSGCHAFTDKMYNSVHFKAHAVVD